LFSNSLHILSFLLNLKVQENCFLYSNHGTPDFDPDHFIFKCVRKRWLHMVTEVERMASGARKIDRSLVPSHPAGTESTIGSQQAGFGGRGGGVEVRLGARDFQQLNSIQSTQPTPHTLSF
jgi:hypothetical protein